MVDCFIVMWTITLKKSFAFSTIKGVIKFSLIHVFFRIVHRGRSGLHIRIALLHAEVDLVEELVVAKTVYLVQMAAEDLHQNSFFATHKYVFFISTAFLIATCCFKLFVEFFLLHKICCIFAFVCFLFIYVDISSATDALSTLSQHCKS